MSLVLAASALLFATPMGQETPETETPRAERRICRRDSGVGSRLAPRVCLTAAEWQARDGDRRDTTRRFLDQSERDGREHSPYPTPN